MKIFTQKLRVLALTALCLGGFLATPTKGCVVPDTSVIIHCDYDSNFTDIAVRVSNLRLFGGNPNEFCSCAITNFTDIFTNILYISFVDSGTTTPLTGFDPWTPEAAATNAWENVLATGNWAGYVSQVGQSGLNAGTAVELYIRASLPPGYTFSLLDSNLVITQMGTDEWDNANQDLANSHQKIRGFWANPTTYTNQPKAWFAALDGDLTVGIKDPVGDARFAIFPNPSTGMINLLMEATYAAIRDVKVYNSTGALVMQAGQEVFSGSEARLDLSSQPAGIYFVKVQTQSGLSTRKVILME